MPATPRTAKPIAGTRIRTVKRKPSVAPIRATIPNVAMVIFNLPLMCTHNPSRCAMFAHAVFKVFHSDPDNRLTAGCESTTTWGCIIGRSAGALSRCQHRVWHFQYSAPQQFADINTPRYHLWVDVSR